MISKKELTRLVKDMYGMIQSESPDTVRIIEIVQTFETVRFENLSIQTAWQIRMKDIQYQPASA